MIDRLELAKWLHDNYEAIAKDKNWNTQENCKVDFDTLPPQNKLTMLELADRILKFNLLRLYFVSGSVCDVHKSDKVCPKCENDTFPM